MAGPAENSKTCADILEIFPETAVLAFDVMEWSDTTSPRRLAEAKVVQEAITKELNKQADALHKKHFKGDAITEKDAVKLLSTIPKQILEHQKEDALKRLSCAYKESPIGVWIDKNEWVLYVFVPIIVGAAGTYMYVAKTGDQPASWATDMAKAKKSFNVKKLGTIVVGTSDVVFKPSERRVAVSAFGGMKWERVSFKIILGGGLTDGNLNTAMVGGEVTTSLSNNIDLTVGQKGIGHNGDWGGKSEFALRYKGDGAAANMDLSLVSQFAYGDQNSFNALPAAMGPAGASVQLQFRIRFGP